MNRKHVIAWLAMLAIATTALAACTPTAPTQAGQPTAAPAATQPPVDTAAPAPTIMPVATKAPVSEVALPEINPADYEGDIIAAGSSTVFPLAERIAEIFREDGYSGNLTIDSIGSGAGFERFCVAGETDISNASRPIRESEVEACRAIGREPIEFRVGTDALAVVVSTENGFLENVTLEEVAMIFSSDVTQWSEVNPAWPAEDILRFSPGTDSGTFDYFVEAVIRPSFEDAGETKLLEAGNLQLSEDDNVLVQGVEGSPFAIGYFGYAYYQENADRLKILHINGIEPTKASVDSADYPLARPLFIYSDARVMQEKPQVAAFINYFLTYVDDEIRDVGYFPASNEALDASRQAWLAATGQTAQ